MGLSFGFFSGMEEDRVSKDIYTEALQVSMLEE